MMTPMTRTLGLACTLAFVLSTGSCTTIRSSGKCQAAATRCRTACLNAAVVATPPFELHDLRAGTRELVLRATDGPKAGRFARGRLWLRLARDVDRGLSGKLVDGAEDRRRGIRLWGALDIDLAAVGVELPADSSIKANTRDALRPGVLVLRRSGKDGIAEGPITLQVAHPANSRLPGETVIEGQGLLLQVKRLGQFRFSGVWKGGGASGVFCAGVAR